MAEPILSVKDLKVVFHLRRGDFTAVNGISFDIMPGEVLGVVGESGAGKSMTGTAIMGLVDRPGEVTASEEIRLKGERIDGLDEEAMRKIRGRRIGMVFQDPLTSLNPLYTVGEQLIETIRRHLPLSHEQARKRAISLLADAGIPDPEDRINAYPHQFSGGMRQRVVISLALAAEPELVIADEPTSALDVSVQAQIIKVLKRLCAERGVAVMLITHDMGVIAEAADRMIVMNKGEIVETGSVGDIIHRPKEPYTQKLIEAIPSIKAQNPRYVAAAAQAGGDTSKASAEPLVVVEHLSKDFDLSSSFLSRITGNRKIVKAVNDVTFAIEKGRTYGLVGESGSGKSTCARMMVGLLEPSGGSVRLEGTDIWRDRNAHAKRRSKIQMIFQDPYASLNPRWRVGQIIAEPMRALGISRNGGEIGDRVADLLRRVRLDPEVMGKYPHEFSGGQRQRIAIARALSSQPDFIICDEPTSALDVSVQAQVLELMSQLQEEFSLTYLLISHNLAVVRQMADAVGVLHHGVLVESGPVEEIFGAPKADYTRMLLDAVPDIAKVA